MASRNRLFRPPGLPALAGVAAVAISLGGCSPIETWRALSGANKNDPDPVTAPFSGNMAAAEAAPYPNLASVPPPPTRATSAAERQKLAQALVAERSAAAALARAAPSAGQAVAAAPATATAPVPGSAAGVAPAPATVTARPAEKAAANATEPAPRRTVAPAEAPPQDSPLQVPQVRLLPEPETARPAPPPPRLAAISPPPPPDLPPAAAASAAPMAAPPPPALAPVAPPPSPRAEPRRPPAAMTVATLDGLDRSQIERVAALYRDQPAGVRVVAHAAAPSPGGDPLALYRAALDRAQEIAKALADAGIPASRIHTEATPAVAGRTAAAGRVEIQFLP